MSDVSAPPADKPRPHRDDFTEKTKTLLAQRVGWLCSNPDCRAPTLGPRMGELGVMNLGVAAHITAASPGFARYDASFSREQRKAFHNGIWLCEDHAHQIDHDEKHFTTELLHKWKQEAETYAFRQLLEGRGGGAATHRPNDDLKDELREVLATLGLPKEDDLDNVRARAAESAIAHIATFEAEESWPRHAVKLGLFGVSKGTAISDVQSVDHFGPALIAAQKASLVAPPGTGKSTTLVQLARVLVDLGPVPLFVPLSEWAESSFDLFGWIANRHAFAGLSAAHLKFLAHHGELALLLDGWNEVPSAGRSRLIQELRGLQRDFPLMCFAMSTRRQARDVPLDAAREMNVAALSVGQQEEIADAVSGDRGLEILSRARQTKGLRELIRIPLYLNALLRGTDGRELPETKDQLLKLFVKEHESDAARAENLHTQLGGHHVEYLEALALAGQAQSNTSISSVVASTALGEANGRLVATYHIASPPNPATVLDVLVNNHTLQRESAESYAFQHQQIQEWYASFSIEAEIARRAEGSIPLDDSFIADKINNRVWEESVLFACERLSRKDADGAKAVANLVTTCLTVDPMLAGAIIERSSSAVWLAVGNAVMAFSMSWHKVGTVDRAVKFMLQTGKADFADTIWPLFSSADRNVQLDALRAASAISLDVIGKRLDAEYASLGVETRKNLLGELIGRGGLDGAEKAIELASAEDSVSVSIEVFQSLWFEGVSKQAEAFLKTCPPAVWHELAVRGNSEMIAAPELSAQLQQFTSEAVAAANTPHERLRLVLRLEDEPERTSLIASSLAEPSFDFRAEGGPSLDYIQRRYPLVVAQAMRERILSGLELPFRSSEYLRPLPVEDSGPIADLVLAAKPSDPAARSGVYLVGLKTVQILIDRYLELRRKIWADGRPNQQQYQPQKELEELLHLARPEPFLEALCEYASETNGDTIAALCDLLARLGSGGSRDEPPVSPELQSRVATVLDEWSETLLANPDSSRNELADLASVMRRYSAPSHVPYLAKMLDREASLYQKAREDFEKDRTNQKAKQSVQTLHDWGYRDALVSQGTPEAAAVLQAHVGDGRFGFDAASGLLTMWLRQHENTEIQRPLFRNDFAAVMANRAARAAGSEEVSEFATTIFEEVEKIGVGDEASVNRARGLAGIGAMMPHGDKAAVLERLIENNGKAATKHRLMKGMAIGGLTLRSADIQAGLAQLLDEAKQQPWLLDHDFRNVLDWLELFTFSEQPLDLIEAISSLKQSINISAWRLRDILSSSIRYAPDDVRVPLLRALGEAEPELVAQYEWYTTLLTAPASETWPVIFDIAEGKLGKPKDLEAAGFHLAGNLRASMQPEDLERLKRQFAETAASPAKQLMARILLERADDATFLMLVADQSGRDAIGQSFHMSIEALAYRKTSLNGSGTSYELSPRDASELREGLFRLAAESLDAATAIFARRCLTVIDEMRDEGGAVETEARHPDISSGRPWPMVGAT